MILLSAAQFLDHGNRLTNRGPYQTSVAGQAARKSDIDRFVTYFGVTPFVTAKIWQCLLHHDFMPDKGTASHLLWALMLLKLYSTEEVLAGIANVTAKTFRKWSQRFVLAISQLKPHVVSCFLYFCYFLFTKKFNLPSCRLFGKTGCARTMVVFAKYL